MLSKSPEIDGQSASAFRCSVQRSSFSPWLHVMSHTHTRKHKVFFTLSHKVLQDSCPSVQHVLASSRQPGKYSIAQPYIPSDSELIQKYQMQISPGTKLISITWWENTIIFPSLSIGLFRILSASCLASYCSQFPSASIPTSKLNLSRNMFFLITFMSFSRSCSKCWPTSPLLCLPSHCVAMFLQQGHSKTWWRPCAGCCADAQRKCTDILDSQ